MSAPTSEWKRAIGPWAWQFPRDHGAHPDFKTEWWYFTGNLREEKTGRPFGYQLTIFRQGLQIAPAQRRSRWAIRDFYFAHFTLSDIEKDRFYSAEKIDRGVFGQAGASTNEMKVWVRDWKITALPEPDHYALTARMADGALDLQLKAAKPLVRHGLDGLSQKAAGEGHASYYYSYPRLDTSGSIVVGGRKFTVAGTSWFDHEFSSSSLGADQVGWDWFSVQLDNNEELMIYLLRRRDGSLDPMSQGTLVESDGHAVHLSLPEIAVTPTRSWTSPKTGAHYPAGWRMAIPKAGLELEITPAMADQELSFKDLSVLAYWEGACRITGNKNGHPVSGVGYTELTGYATPLGNGMKE